MFLRKNLNIDKGSSPCYNDYMDDKYSGVTKLYKNVIGMNECHVVLAEHNPLWKEIFEWNKSVLEEMLEEWYDVDIHHIGSTSVDTIELAKPIIDILVVNKSPDKKYLEPEHIALRNGLYVPEDCVPDGEVMLKVIDKSNHLRTLNRLHFANGSESNFAKRALRFKEYMKAFPEEAKKYTELKKSLEVQNLNVLEYAWAKHNYMVEVNLMAAKEMELETISK